MTQRVQVLKILGLWLQELDLEWYLGPEVLFRRRGFGRCATPPPKADPGAFFTEVLLVGDTGPAILAVSTDLEGSFKGI